MESRWKSHVRRWCTSWKSQKKWRSWHLSADVHHFHHNFRPTTDVIQGKSQPHPLTPSDPSRMANLELYPSVTLYQVSDTQKNIISSITAKIQMTLISLYDPKMLCLSWDHMPIVNALRGVSVPFGYQEHGTTNEKWLAKTYSSTILWCRVTVDICLIRPHKRPDDCLFLETHHVNGAKSWTYYEIFTNQLWGREPTTIMSCFFISRRKVALSPNEKTINIYKHL